MSIIIKGLDIDSHRVIKCFIVPYKDRAQLVVGNKYDEGKTYDIFEVPVSYGKWTNGDCRCPICGEDKFKGLDADIWSDWKPNYCPNCGANMKDEKDEKIY